MTTTARSFLKILLVFFTGCSARSNSHSQLITKDFNSFTQNMEEKDTRQAFYFLGMEKLQNVKLGMTEAEVYRVLGSTRFKTRYSFDKVLAKRLRKMKYIPITKTVSFYGAKTNIIEGEGYIGYDPVENLGVAFFFYNERLIYFTINHMEKKDNRWIQLQDSTEEVLYVEKHEDTEQPLGYAETSAAGDAKFYGLVNGYLGEKFSSSGERHFVPLVALNKNRGGDSLADLCKFFAYWEFPDYESDLKKSGYYKLKAKLDKDYENKTGYWKVEEKSKI